MSGRAAAPDYVGPALDRLNAVNHELTSIFGEAGFQPVEPAILQPAALLFRLYGEEIWDRAFVVEDAEAEGWCLRPDFTAPVARLHLARRASGAAPAEARYGYFGPVFRRAPADAAAQPVQMLQAGMEVVAARTGAEDAASDAAVEAEVYALTLRALRLCGAAAPAAVTGDLGVVFTLLDRLPLPAGWRRRLRRHVWRPERFQALLRGFAGGGAAPTEAAPQSRLALLKALGALAPDEAEAAVREMLALAETPQIGRRGADEAASRFLSLAADAQGHPLPDEVAALIEAVLAVRAPSDAALARLRDLAAAGGVDLGAPLDRMEARLAALSAVDVEPATLPFDAAFGRNLEYYDGFVFEMTAKGPGGGALKLGGGGRYDRLFDALGAASPYAAVGAALRPEALVAVAALAERDAASANTEAPT